MLNALFICIPLLMLAGPAFAADAIGTADAYASGSEERRLRLSHTHTNETIDVFYWRNGEYQPEALEDLNYFLRDSRTGDTTEMDPALFDLLHEIYTLAGSNGWYEIISAYRSPKTNTMLRSRSNGVAKRSQHLEGRAMDVRLTDVPTARIRQIALELKTGGVGFYRKSDFVHLDTAGFRIW
jgi:uncharacterized protein YcbK (DUF882 family)